MTVLISIFIPLSQEGGTRRGGDYHWYFSAPLTYLEMCSMDKCQVNGKFARVCLFICPFSFVVFVVLVFLFGFDFVFELVN